MLFTDYPDAYAAGANEPYYPIPSPAAAERLSRYLTVAATPDGRMFFAGRLGDYAYYNIDQASARALALFKKRIVPIAIGGLVAGQTGRSRIAVSG